MMTTYIEGSEKIINDYLKNEKPKWLATCSKVNRYTLGRVKMVDLSFVQSVIKEVMYSILLGQQ